MRCDLFSALAIALSIGVLTCAAPDAAAQNAVNEDQATTAPKPAAPSQAPALDPPQVPDEAGTVTKRYDPRMALELSLWPTVTASLVGGALLIASFPVVAKHRSTSFAHGTALRFSGVIMIELGLIPGPSLGHFYAGEQRKPWMMILGRSLFAGLVDGGMGVLFWSALGCGEYPCEGSEKKSQLRLRDAGIAMDVIGGAGMLALAIADIATVKSHAERANAAAQKRSIAVLPFVGSGLAGLSVAAEF